jgi:hypothetical protein
VVLKTDIRDQIYPLYKYQSRKGQAIAIILLSLLVYLLGFYYESDFKLGAILLLTLGLFYFAINYLQREVTLSQQFEIKKKTIFMECKKFN